jgi:hypothetical protein
MNKTIIGCPYQCQLDSLRNKCDPLYKGFICGAIDLIATQMNVNGTDFCPPKYMLININSNQFNESTYCGPQWYYDNDQSTQGKPFIDSHGSFSYF